MDELRLIRGAFWLLAGTVGGALSLFFGMSVNDVVRVPKGELLADRPRAVYRAPFDVRVDSVFVAEGSRVRRGQPLMVLSNETVRSELAQAAAEREALREEQAMVALAVGNAAARVRTLRAQVAASHDRFAVTVGDARTGEGYLASQVRLADERVALARVNEERHRQLLERRMLAPPEYEAVRRARLEAQGAADLARRQLAEVRSTGPRLGAERRAEVARLDAENLSTEAARLSLVERGQRLARQIEKQDDVVRLRRELADRQRVVAEADGTIRFVFNTKAASNLLRAGEVLVEVAPQAEGAGRVYAKLHPSQAAIRRVRAGQRAQVRLDAYHYYRYGPVRGTVRYVSPPDDSSGYFVLVDLDPRREIEVRPGYTVRGDIVVARMKLYEFTLRRLFNRLET